MRAVLVIMVALLVAAGIAMLAARDPGSVVISMSGWSMQTSLVFFSVLLILLFFAAYLILRLLSRLVSMPETLRMWRGQRRQRKSEDYLIRGLLALIEGRPQDAEESLIKGVRHAASPLLNYLCAARAAQRLGKPEQRDTYLELAAAERPDDKLSVELVRSELQIADHRTEMALESLTYLNNEYPSHSQARLLLLRCCIDLHAWQDAIVLLPRVEKSGLLASDEIMTIKIVVYGGLLQRAGATENMKRLDDAWKEIPGKLRSLPTLLGVYVLEKLKFADAADCEPLLRQALENRWDANLVNLYGLVTGKDTKRQLAFAENLLSGHQQDAGLHLTLGRLYVCNSLLDKALTSLKRSLELKPLPETCRELATLYEKQCDYSTASGYYQQGLALATSIVRHETVKLQEQVEQADEITAGARQVY